MRARLLVAGLLAFGVLGWLASRIVNSHPTVVAVWIVAALVFFAVAVRRPTV